jgi:hypothetical protein
MNECTSESIKCKQRTSGIDNKIDFSWTASSRLSLIIVNDRRLENSLNENNNKNVLI